MNALLRKAARGLGLLALLFAAACVLVRPAAAANGVLRGLGLCYQTVIPALFPFLVLSRLILESPAAKWLGLLLRPYTRLIGVRGEKAPAALLCGLLGGFACGAQSVDALYRADELERDEAARLLVCAIGSGPGFIVGGVGALMLGRAGAGWLLLAAQVGASLLCGAGAACFAALRKGQARSLARAAVPCSANGAARNFGERYVFPRPGDADGQSAGSAARRFRIHRAAGEQHAPRATDTAHDSSVRAAAPSEPPPAGFVPAVQRAVTATVTLCGYVTLFSFFSVILVPQSAPPLARFLATLPLEVTAACRAACDTAGAWRSELCCAALSAMGASVFFQVRALTSPEISLAPLACSRLLHLPLALALFRLAARLFPEALAAGAPLDAAILPAVRMPPDVMAVLFVLAALSCGAIRPRGGALHGGQRRL